jgi:long-chain acyl-CoA synthetase
VYPGEVEKMLERHPDINQAVVVPVDDELKFKKPVAFVISRSGAELTEEHVRQFALANAAAYLHPRRVWFLDEMPLAGTNKTIVARLQTVPPRSRPRPRREANESPGIA